MTGANAKTKLRYFRDRQSEILSTVRELAGMESPSDSKAAVDRLSSFVAEKFSAIGGTIHIHPSKEFGNHCQVDFSTKSNDKPVLLLGHYDTVYPVGTLKTMPCRIDGDKLLGPGVLDMKSGIALMIHAIRGLQEWNGALPRLLTVLLVSDEEVGSSSSRAITERLAKKSGAVLVLAAGLRPASNWALAHTRN